MHTDSASHALLRLMTWLSPAFPVGAFAYSGGLEGAVQDKLICSENDLQEWLVTLVQSGAIWNDLVLLAQAHKHAADTNRLQDIAELAQGLAGSEERYREIRTIGEAFVAAARAWPHPILDYIGERPAYCVAVGAIAGAHNIAVEPAAVAFLHATVSQAVSAAIRLGVIGQRQGVAALADLETEILDIAAKAANSGLDDLGTATILADISIMRHEEQHSRLFRS